MTFIGIDTKDTVFETVEANVDIPLDDMTAYSMYPKYNWVYSTSRLFDMQGVEWSPFPVGNLVQAHDEFPFTQGSCEVYTKEITGERLSTDVAVLKGHIVWAAHHADGKVLDDLRGDIELVISALTTLHFKKFAGIISVDTIGTKITGVRLRMSTEMVEKYPEDWLKRVLRIYNRRPWGK